jgi:hypothetical protein
MAPLLRAGQVNANWRNFLIDIGATGRVSVNARFRYPPRNILGLFVAGLGVVESGYSSEPDASRNASRQPRCVFL